MKIKNSRASALKKFADVEVGNVFMRRDVVYMKTDASAVNLDSGATTVFNPEMMVEPVDAEMKIR